MTNLEAAASVAFSIGVRDEVTCAVIEWLGYAGADEVVFVAEFERAAVFGGGSGGGEGGCEEEGEEDGDWEDGCEHGCVWLVG